MAMKFPTVTAAAVLAILASFAIEVVGGRSSTSIGGVKDTIASIIGQRKQRRRAEHDDIKLTEECAASTRALGQNRELINAVDDIMSVCKANMDGSREISWDFTSCNTTAAEEACAAAGGMQYTHDIFLSCSGKDQSITVDLTSVPDCFGASCDTENIEAVKASTFQDMFTNLNAAGYVCGKVGLGFWQADNVNEPTSRAPTILTTRSHGFRIIGGCALLLSLFIS